MEASQENTQDIATAPSGTTANGIKQGGGCPDTPFYRGFCRCWCKIARRAVSVKLSATQPFERADVEDARRCHWKGGLGR